MLGHQAGYPSVQGLHGPTLHRPNGPLGVEVARPGEGKQRTAHMVGFVPRAIHIYRPVST